MKKIRIGANYDDVLNNIKRFHEIRTKMDASNPLTRVSMVMVPGNETSYEAYINLFSDIVDIVAYDDYIDHYKDYGFLKTRRDIKVACSFLWQRMLISTDGTIGVCCMDHNTEFGIGNINNTTIKEAWNSSEYKELRKLHKEMKWYEIEKCSTCPVVLFESSGSV